MGRSIQVISDRPQPFAVRPLALPHRRSVQHTQKTYFIVSSMAQLLTSKPLKFNADGSFERGALSKLEKQGSAPEEDGYNRHERYNKTFKGHAWPAADNRGKT